MSTLPATYPTHTDALAPIASHGTTGYPTSTSVSVFDSIEIFETSLRMAEVLSRSALVPKSFQGSPESCLVALDLARRLEVSPLTLLPHLYVIDSKPSFSTQFLITLVNRSGKFNRLEYESGIDGETVVTFSRWDDKQKKSVPYEEKVPNYYSIAILTEKKTGKEYRSPKVDIRFAELNGWTTKNGSKWRTMPELMTSYRAASILIKRTCPELTLGLDFAEDIADGVDEAPSADYRTVESSVIDDYGADAKEAEARVDAFIADIVRSSTLSELEKHGSEVAKAKLPEAERDQVAAAYRKKQAELSKKDALPEITATLLSDVASAKSKDDLTSLLERARSFAHVGELSQDDLSRVMHAIDARAEGLGI